MVTSPPVESDVVFNVVWAGEVYPYLRTFVASLLDRTEARFRFVVNGCPAEHLPMMAAFAERHPDRVIDLIDLDPPHRPYTHGEALDRVRAQRDDGPLFATIDSDILARGPFLADLLGELVDDVVAVTSGRGVWADTDVVPEGHPGVNGEYFFDRSGFTFGSPHLAVYRREPLEATCERWGVGFGAGGPELDDRVRARLAEAGHDYWVYDTAKVVNVLLQLDGGTLRHREHPGILHIGGMSHFFAPWQFVEAVDGTGMDGSGMEPDWARWDGMASRYEVARYTAGVLSVLTAGGTAPPIPEGVDPALVGRLEEVRAALIDVVGAHRGD